MASAAAAAPLLEMGADGLSYKRAVSDETCATSVPLSGRLRPHCWAMATQLAIPNALMMMLTTDDDGNDETKQKDNKVELRANKRHCERTD